MTEDSTGKGLAAIYRQKIIQDVTLFTSQSAAAFYDKLFSSLDFTLPRAATGRRGFSKEAIRILFGFIRVQIICILTIVLPASRETHRSH